MRKVGKTTLDGKFIDFLGYLFTFKWNLVKRWLRLLWERVRYGWDESETWDLGGTIAKQAIPRLEVFIEKFEDTIDNENMVEDLKIVLQALEMVAEFEIPDTEEKKEIRNKGMKLFGEYLPDLWW